MLNNEHSHDLLGELTLNARMEHQSRQGQLVEAETMNLFVLLKPEVSIDGNQYCVLYGKNLQEGICGFGDTIMAAIIDFNRQFQLPINER